MLSLKEKEEVLLKGLWNGKLHLSLIVFLTSLLFTFQIWDFYFNSPENFNHTVVANIILGMGILFSIAAGLFARAVESRRDFLEKEVKRKSEDLVQKNRENRQAETAAAAIYQSCHILFGEIRLENLLERIMELMAKVLRADEGSIMLVNGQELFVAASRGIPADVARQIRIKIGERVAGRAALLRREFLLVDGLENYPEFKGIESNGRIRSSIVFPLVCQDELLGVLNLNRTVTRENFTVADMLNVSIFAAQVAQAIRNASLYRTLERKIVQLEEAHQKVHDLERQLGIGI